MKTLRLFGLTLMALLLSVNLTSCSDDDDPTKNPEAIIGEWFLIHEKYWGEDEDGKYNEEYSYDLNNPEEGAIKWIIKEGNGKNEFIVKELFYNRNENWSDDEDFSVILDGDKFIMESDYEDDDIVSENTTYKLKNDKLTIKIKVVYKDGTEDNAENTYKKI